MKQLLTRLWQWLINLFGAKGAQRRRETDGLPPAARPIGLPPTAPPPAPPQVQAPAALPPSIAPPAPTLPPPAPPQLDLHTGEPPRFGRKASVLTKAEQRFYHSLLLAAGSRYAILPKVRLWDFIWLVNEPPDRKQYLNRLSCRHVDFLLCEPGTLAPWLVIELDDRSHQRPEAQAADQFKNELFEAVGLPLWRVSPQESGYRSALLRDQIETLLGTRG